MPIAVARWLDGRPFTEVWTNEAGGRTFKVDDARGGVHLKWNPTGSSEDLEAEAARMLWASPYTAVPEVVSVGGDGEGSWLCTTTIDAPNAVDPIFHDDPARTARALGQGLRQFHDALPVEGCPWSWSAYNCVEQARSLIDEASIATLEEPFSSWSATELIGYLEDIPAIDRVVCQGDPCAPNTLLDPSRRCVGHVDLARLGVADRWADLSVMAWSVEWNFGPGFELEVYAGYGIALEERRRDYYRVLWRLS